MSLALSFWRIINRSVATVRLMSEIRLTMGSAILPPSARNSEYIFIVSTRWEVNRNRRLMRLKMKHSKSRLRVPVAYIYRPYRTLPDGRIIWARHYGLKAWRIPVYEEDVLD